MVIVGVASVPEAVKKIPGACLLSITDPGTSPPDVEVARRLDLAFRDVSLPVGTRPPRREDAQRILAFAETVGREAIVVHCTAGFSRSPAAAIGVGIVHAGITKETATDQQVLAAVEAAHLGAIRAEQLDLRGGNEVEPNMWLVALFDHVLHLEGRLLAATCERYYHNPWPALDRRVEALMAFAAEDDPEGTFAHLARKYRL